jgi:hypothetical protein
VTFPPPEACQIGGLLPVDRAGRARNTTISSSTPPASACGQLTGGNRNDITQLTPLLAKDPPTRDMVARPRRPNQLLADRAYDHDKCRRLLQAKGITPVIARRGHHLLAPPTNLRQDL